MKYHFQYEAKALDFWQLSMYYTYGSLVGVCNVIFTVAMILLTYRFWGAASPVTRTALILACLAFPVIQPIGVYAKAKKQIATIPKDMEIGFDDQGIHVKAGEEKSDLPWKSIKRVSKKPSLIVIFSSTTHGFILNNKTLGQDRDAFYQYIVSKMNK